MLLVIQVHDDTKIVEVWLTNAEKNNPAIKKNLAPLFRSYKDRKYTVAMFLSGAQELKRNTLELLRYNKRRSAEMEVAREKKQSAAVIEH